MEDQFGLVRVSRDDCGLQSQVEQVAHLLVGALPRLAVGSQAAPSVWSKLRTVLALAQLVNCFKLVNNAEPANDQIKVFQIGLREIVARLLRVCKEGGARVWVSGLLGLLDKLNRLEGNPACKEAPNRLLALHPLIVEVVRCGAKFNCRLGGQPDRFLAGDVFKLLKWTNLRHRKTT